jgi:hypothetical protein
MLVLVLTTVIEAFVSTAPVASVTVPWIAAYTFCAHAIGNPARQRIERTGVAKKKILSFIISPHVVYLAEGLAVPPRNIFPYFHTQETPTPTRIIGQIAAFESLEPFESNHAMTSYNQKQRFQIIWNLEAYRKPAVVLYRRLLPMEFLIAIPARTYCWFPSRCRAMSLAHAGDRAHLEFHIESATRLCDKLQIGGFRITQLGRSERLGYLPIAVGDWKYCDNFLNTKYGRQTATVFEMCDKDRRFRDDQRFRSYE